MLDEAARTMLIFALAPLFLWAEAIATACYPQNSEVVMDDAGDDAACDDYQPQDTSEPKTRKTLNPEWFKQPPRPPTLDLECNKRQVVLDQLAQPWFNQMVSALKNPLTFNDLMVTLIDFSNIELKYNFQEWFNALTDKLDCNNLEGDRYPFDLSKHLPLQGPLGLKKVSFDDLTPEHHGDSASCLVCSTKLSTSTKRVLRVDELYKFSNGTLKSVCDEIHHRVLDFHLDYNKDMPKRKWMTVD
ncbi:hypothetical protein Tco_0307490 [Tanacetum coccineum]